MGFIESLIVGIVQGITEWIPISSEGMTSLVLTQGFNSSLQEAIIIAIWLHLGTLLAAIIYFRKDIIQILKKRDEVFTFLAISTIITVLVGGPIIIFILDSVVFSGQGIMLLIGVLLIITGLVLFFSKNITPSKRKPSKIDAIIAGIAQGFAVLPGLSRSGLTLSALLFRRYDATSAIRLSFLMSIPAVAIAGLWALTKSSTFSPIEAGSALMAAFIFGLLTISVMLKIARKVNFSIFVLFIGILSIIAGFL